MKVGWNRGSQNQNILINPACDNVISYTALRLSLLFRSPDIFIDWSISERRLVVVFTTIKTNRKHQKEREGYMCLAHYY